MGSSDRSIVRRRLHRFVAPWTPLREPQTYYGTESGSVVTRDELRNTRDRLNTLRPTTQWSVVSRPCPTSASSESDPAMQHLGNARVISGDRTRMGHRAGFPEGPQRLRYRAWSSSTMVIACRDPRDRTRRPPAELAN